MFGSPPLLSLEEGVDSFPPPPPLGRWGGGGKEIGKKGRGKLLPPPGLVPPPPWGGGGGGGKESGKKGRGKLLPPPGLAPPPLQRREGGGGDPLVGGDSLPGGAQEGGRRGRPRGPYLVIAFCRCSLVLLIT